MYFTGTFFTITSLPWQRGECSMIDSTTMERSTISTMGKSTISMVIFNSELLAYLVVVSFLVKINTCFLFPRASERRVLPIVGVCISSSHLHTFSSSHLLIFTPSHTFSSSHLLIFTPSHTFSSSHLLIFTSAHLHICSSSHLLIFTSAHLHICSSSHLLIFSFFLSLTLTSAHTHIFSLSFFSLSFFSLSHAHIFTYSHLLSLLFLSRTLTSSHTHIFSLSFLSPFSLSRLLYLSLFRPRVVPAVSHET